MTFSIVIYPQSKVKLISLLVKCDQETRLHCECKEFKGQYYGIREYGLGENFLLS